MNILLLDAYSATHTGNTALLDSSLDNLRREFPEAQFSALAKHPPSMEAFCGCPCFTCLLPELMEPEKRTGLRMITWLAKNAAWTALNTVNLGLLRRLGLRISPLAYSFNPDRRKAVRAMMDADIVVSISGEMVNDSFWKITVFLLHGYWMAQRLGKLTVIFPQSFGPLRKPWLANLSRRVLNGCDLVIPRDRFSVEELERIGLRPDIVRHIPDVAIMQPQETPEEALALLVDQGFDPVRRPVLGVTVSEARGGEGSERDLGYLDAVRQLCEHVAVNCGGQVVFLTANLAAFGPEHEDFPVAKRLYDSLSPQARQHAVLLAKLYSARQFKAITNIFDVFVTTRMHSSILATMSPVPTITLNTQRKLRGYMEVIGQAEWSVDIADATPERLRDTFDHCLARNDEIRGQLQAKREELAPKVLESGQTVRRLWDARRNGKA